MKLTTSTPISSEVIGSVNTIITPKLDESFFRVRFDRLTNKEKLYLRAMAELGSEPQRTGDIAGILGAKLQSLTLTRSNLIKKGMIYAPDHGMQAFTVPLFDEFIKRVIPNLEIGQ